jgi:predicted ATPase/DNA-binding SARP family transcriptional activator
MDTPWRIELLGGLWATQGDRVVSRFRTQKTAALLAYLAYFNHRSHPRAALIDLLWPECELDAGRNQLRMALTSLRHQLEPPGVPAGAVIIADRSSVRLNPSAYVTDVAQFEAALQAAQSAGSPTEQSRWLTEAIAQYRGELLPGGGEPWIVPERQRLAEAYLQALQQLMLHRERAGDLSDALQIAWRAAAADPLQEEACCDLIRLLAAANQPRMALLQYEEIERLLAQELGLSPGEELRELGRALRSQVGSEAARIPERLCPDAISGPEPQQLPSPGAPPASQGNLPLQFTAFFGREDELTRLQRLLHPAPTLDIPRARLVTLTGPGGSGKTRLALEAARRLRDPFRSAVWFVPLQDLSDAHQIEDQLLRTLRVSRASSLQPLDQGVAVLSRQPSLLLLDNFEHLVAVGVELVQALLERVETVTVLVTSRQSLGLPGEREFPVPPLPVPAVRSSLLGDAAAPKTERRGQHTGELTLLLSCPSVRLFVDRAQAVRPDFQLTRSNAEAVAALCRGLEGLPLALEMAAARAAVLTPAQMLQRLEQRFGLLVSRQRTAPLRHRSLRAALDWSYQLLSPEMQRFFAHLSVFRSSFTLEAAEAVSAEPQALEYLTHLRECSLVLAEDAGSEMRYRLLESLREYGTEQLGLDERTALARQHAQYYLALAEAAEPGMVGANQATYFPWLEREHNNLRAALDWLAASGDAEAALRLAGALWEFWAGSDHRAEGRDWLVQVLALARAQARTPARAKALLGAGTLSCWEGNCGPARLFLEECRSICGELGDRKTLAWSLLYLGQMAFSEGDAGAAQSLLTQSLAIGQELADARVSAHALSRLAQAARSQDDDAAARAFLEESLALFRKWNLQRGTARALTLLGDLALSQNDGEAARAFFEESLMIRRALGAQGYIAEVLSGVGKAALLQGDAAAARASFQERLVIYREIGDRSGVAASLYGLGQVALCHGEREAARSLFTQSLTLRRELEDQAGIADCLESLAKVSGPGHSMKRY